MSDVSFLVGMVALACVFFLESPLWIPSFRDRLPWIPGLAVVALAVLAPVQGWLTGLYLESKTLAEGGAPPGLRRIGSLLASVPLLGLYALPAWRQLPSRWQERLRRPTSRDLPGFQELPRRDLSHEISRPLLRSLVFPVLLIAIHFGLPILGCLWWARSTADLPEHRGVTLAACAVLHGIAALCIAHHFREIRRRLTSGGSLFLLRIVPVLLLLGLPGVVLGFFLGIRLLGTPGSSTLAWASHARNHFRSGPVWLDLQAARQVEGRGAGPSAVSWMRRRRPAVRSEAGEAEDARLALFRLKTFFAILEAAALAWLWGSLPLVPASAKLAGWEIAMWGAGGLAGAGLALQGVALTARAWGDNQISRILVPHPYGRYLLLPGVAVLLGLYLGRLLAAGMWREAGLLVGVASPLGAVLAFFFFLPWMAERKSNEDLALWAALFMAGAFLGLPLIRLKGTEPVLPWLLALLGLVSLALGAGLGGWLLRPFQWRHLLDRRLPLRVRLTLGAVVAAAAAPLGAVAIPFWIYVRHRCLPKWEALRGDQPLAGAG